MARWSSPQPLQGRHCTPRRLHAGYQLDALSKGGGRRRRAPRPSPWLLGATPAAGAKMRLGWPQCGLAACESTSTRTLDAPRQRVQGWDCFFGRPLTHVVRLELQCAITHSRDPMRVHRLSAVCDRVLHMDATESHRVPAASQARNTLTQHYEANPQPSEVLNRPSLPTAALPRPMLYGLCCSVDSSSSTPTLHHCTRKREKCPGSNRNQTFIRQTLVGCPWRVD